MGWLFTEGQSRREVIHARLHRQWCAGYSGACLAHALRGNIGFDWDQIAKCFPVPAQHPCERSHSRESLFRTSKIPVRLPYDTYFAPVV